MDVDGIHAIRYTSIDYSLIISFLTLTSLRWLAGSIAYIPNICSKWLSTIVLISRACYLDKQRLFQIKWCGFFLLESPFLLISFTLHDNQQGENQTTPNALCLKSSAKYPGSLIIHSTSHRIIWRGFHSLITTIAFQSPVNSHMSSHKKQLYCLLFIYILFMITHRFLRWQMLSVQPLGFFLSSRQNHL